MKSRPFVLTAFLTIATPLFATVTVTSPGAGVTVTSPVHCVASATATTCATGVAAMGIYVNNELVYTVNGTTLNTEIALALGSENTVVEEWDFCGGATFTAVNLTIEESAAPIVSITAKSGTITGGSSTTLTVTATNSSAVIIAGSYGTAFRLAATGGTQTVSPTTSTTHTAKATGTAGGDCPRPTLPALPGPSARRQAEPYADQ